MQNYIIVMTFKALMCSGIATKVWRILYFTQPIKKITYNQHREYAYL